MTTLHSLCSTHWDFIYNVNKFYFPKSYNKFSTHFNALQSAHTGQHLHCTTTLQALWQHKARKLGQKQWNVMISGTTRYLEPGSAALCTGHSAALCTGQSATLCTGGTLDSGECSTVYWAQCTTVYWAKCNTVYWAHRWTVQHCVLGAHQMVDSEICKYFQSCSLVSDKLCHIHKHFFTNSNIFQLGSAIHVTQCALFVSKWQVD